MVTRRIETHNANILIKMEGEGDWAAKKEKINGAETIVFFKKAKASSPLQALRDKLDNIMSGTAAANKYLKKMHINKDHSILLEMKDPNKKKITKDSLNSYIENLYSISTENGKLSRSIKKMSNTEILENNFLSVLEIISFAESKDSSKSLNLINYLIKNNGGSNDLKTTQKKKDIIKYVNFALDDSYQDKSIQGQIEHKKKCAEAYSFLRGLKLPESDPEYKEISRLINKLKVIETTKASTDSQTLKMKLDISGDVLEEIGGYFLKNCGKNIEESRMNEIIKFIDVAIDPTCHKKKYKKDSEFRKLCSDTKANLLELTQYLNELSHSQRNIYKLIDHLNLIIDGTISNTALHEKEKSIDSLTNFLMNHLKDEISAATIRKIERSVKSAFYNFYDIDTKENSQDSINNTLQRLGDANQTLCLLRELVSPDASTNAIAKEAVATLDKLIEALNNKIDNLKLKR